MSECKKFQDSGKHCFDNYCDIHGCQDTYQPTNAIAQARRERLWEGLTTLSEWAAKRAGREYNTDTTITMLARKVQDIMDSVDKAGWRASKHPDPAKYQSIKMREARTKAQAHDMTKEEFRAQTPPELRGPEQAESDTPSQQWQPIETVPKDGTEVIVVDVDGNRFIASSTDGHNLCDGFYPIDYPTHWMPLPEPPLLYHK